MYFFHDAAMRRKHPTLVAAVMHVRGVSTGLNAADAIARFQAQATERLAAGAEGEFPEIQAWRRAFSAMGFKPTQYRCAAESLLRRFRKEGALPALHPLVDLCNAASLAFAIPVAVFDLAHVDRGLVVRGARGDETYLAFSGEAERPEPNEVIFADEMDRAHARRWTHRQSALSAVSPGTRDVLVVAEALHVRAREDLLQLAHALTAGLQETPEVEVRSDMLEEGRARFEF